MAILAAVLSRLKKLFVVLFAVLKKPFCCRRRTRRNSGMILPMTVTTTDGHNQHNVSAGHHWPTHAGAQHMTNNSANFATNSHSNQHTFSSNGSQNLYFNSNTQQNTVSVAEEPPPEVEEDFFRDMVPQFRRTKKIVLTSNESTDNQKSNRFGVDAKATIFQSKELGAMDHFEDPEGAGSWEDSAADEMWDTDQSFRDLRQQERERRIAEHQRIKQEREAKRAKQPKGNLLATKIS
ncbi:unnamed protein product [Medioppia subpectinata]|uniref:Receptor-binding cancer antigen n=1 Tax=Medioppia subpectinata TaxID=1979941 RepID=A0A7R9PWQ2_9ACAR|nr:unnamed protein product [Medioppia subpectinata]CAG2103138.1 unnamed protein product [Medioppia subpectinata]